MKSKTSNTATVMAASSGHAASVASFLLKATGRKTYTFCCCDFHSFRFYTHIYIICMLAEHPLSPVQKNQINCTSLNLKNLLVHLTEAFP